MYKICIYILLGLTACANTRDEEQALLDLAHKEKELNCQLAAMKVSISAEWDSINHLLEMNLPETMPAEEKNNMLKVRNAELIRMFQSFDDMDDTVKMALDKTEQSDIEMREQILDLKKEIKNIEAQKMKIFQEISSENSNKEVLRLRELNQSVLNDTCK